MLRGHIGIVRCLSFKDNILISGGDRKRIIAWNSEVSRTARIKKYIGTTFAPALNHHTCIVIFLAFADW